MAKQTASSELKVVHRIFLLMKPIASKRVPGVPPAAEGSDSDNEISSATEISDDREREMWVHLTILLISMTRLTSPISDSVEYLIILQKIRRKCELERETSDIHIYVEEAHKASRADFKRQFATFSAEFRGHAKALVEEMNAYM